MKVDLSTLLKDRVIKRDLLQEVINDLTLYSLPTEELIRLLKNQN